MPPLNLRVCESRVFECPLPERLELGRQFAPDGLRLEPDCYTLVRRPDGSHRLVVARSTEAHDAASRWALLEPLADGSVRITNLSSRLKLAVSGPARQEILAYKQQVELRPPISLSLGKFRTAEILDAPAGPRGSGPRGMLPPGSEQPSLLKPDPSDYGRVPQRLLDWLEQTTEVLQSALGSRAFLAAAANALVKIVGLHSGRVLWRKDNRWEGEPSATAGADFRSPDASRTILDQLLGTRDLVWWEDSGGGPRSASSTDSLVSFHAVVAAPLLSPAGEVIGALYGDVWQHLPASTYGEDEFRRLLVRMLASAVSAGLARQEAERERTLLRQFFSPALADQLSQNRSLIEEARSAEVTVLFCDVRDFSGTSEKLEPAQMFAWISRVLEELSRCVLAQQGVLVDYLGDELMAMWGAPEEQPDHARRAVQAALAMLAAVEELNRQEGLPPTRVGIGLHSGPAQVGNTGSSSRFKYGPLGDTVNIANRIQGMTKYLKCPLLASVETWQQAQRAGGKSAIARRVVTARLAGVQQERDLYELANPASGNGDFFRASQEALQALDEEASKPLKQRNFANVIEQAGGLLKTHRGDGPLQLILARATQAELTGEFARVWTPPGK